MNKTPRSRAYLIRNVEYDSSRDIVMFDVCRDVEYDSSRDIVMFDVCRDGKTSLRYTSCRLWVKGELWGLLSDEEIQELIDREATKIFDSMDAREVMK